MLRPMVSRPVSLEKKAPIWGFRPDFHYCQTVVGWLIWGSLSLWREDWSVIYNLWWASPAQSFCGRIPLSLETIFYCLRFETSLFVASYDSHGYGRGIRTWRKRNFGWGGGGGNYALYKCSPCLLSSWHTMCKFLQYPYARPAVTFANMERRVNLCLQAEAKQFQSLPWPNYFHIYWTACSHNFVFFEKLLLHL
jgi:hypothetical protein